MISSSFVEVPSVIGLHGREAMKVLASKNLRSTITQRGDGTPGIVSSQNPRAGVRVAPNDSVELIVPVVSSVVPNLRGAPLREGDRGVEAGGVAGGEIVDVNNNRSLRRAWTTTRGAHRTPHLVVRSIPEAGSPASPGQVIDLVVRLPQ